MNLETKYRIIEKLIQTEDDEILNQVEAILEHSQFELSDAHKLLLDQRVADHKSNPQSGKSWEEVMSAIRRDL